MALVGMHLLYTLKQELLFFGWRDLLEISLLSWIVYHFSCWLSCDKQKNLILYFYAYCGAIIGAYTLDLSTLYLMLLIGSPVTLLLFIIMHQNTLQKNFITLKNITPKSVSTYHWLETIMQHGLNSINNSQEVLFILERTDALHDFLTNTCPINAPINRALLDLASSQIAHDEPMVLWINHAGFLITKNPLWHVPVDEAWVSEELKTIDSWKQDAIVITEHSDALIFILNPANRLATLMIEGKNITNMTIAQLFSLLKKYIAHTEKDYNHAIITRNATNKQDSPKN